MKKIGLLLCLLILSAQLFAKGHVFFLHNMFAELHPLSEEHPEYGKVEYSKILKAFKKEGFKVTSEIRPKGTDGKEYAKMLAKKIAFLLKQGAKPGEITIVGTSKGGYIAQYLSTYLKNDKINFVFIGSCAADAKDDPDDIVYYGNILSIYEKSDVLGQSCGRMKMKKGSKVTRFKEIELNTGLRHGYLYKAMPEWLEPSMKWANQQYD